MPSEPHTGFEPVPPGPQPGMLPDERARTAEQSSHAPRTRWTPMKRKKSRIEKGLISWEKIHFPSDKPFCFEIQTLFYAPALHCRYAPWLYPMVHFSPNIPSHAENCVREQSLAAAAGFRLCYDRIVRMSCAQHDNIHPFARDKKISVCFPLAYRKNGTTK